MISAEALAEIHEIKNVRILYSHYFDGQELDRLVGLFTEDAVCEFGPEYGGNWEGRETIRNNFKGYMDEEGGPWSVLHSVTNHHVVLDGPDAAHGRCYLIDFKFTEPVESPLFLLGSYNDVYRKIQGRWLIARTRLDFLWPDRYILGKG